jgi:hypothetical protein
MYFYIERIVIFLKGREICKDNFWGHQPKYFEDPCFCMPFNIKILNLKPSSYTTKISLYRLQYCNNFRLKTLMLKNSNVRNVLGSGHYVETQNIFCFVIKIFNINRCTVYPNFQPRATKGKILSKQY